MTDQKSVESLVRCLRANAQKEREALASKKHPEQWACYLRGVAAGYDEAAQAVELWLQPGGGES